MHLHSVWVGAGCCPYILHGRTGAIQMQMCQYHKQVCMCIVLRESSQRINGRPS
jgi:hypothetical protein